jgi:hypothetical protein
MPSLTSALTAAAAATAGGATEGGKAAASAFSTSEDRGVVDIVKEPSSEAAVALAAAVPSDVALGPVAVGDEDTPWCSAARTAGVQ